MSGQSVIVCRCHHGSATWSSIKCCRNRLDMYRQAAREAQTSAPLVHHNIQLYLALRSFSRPFDSEICSMTFRSAAGATPKDTSTAWQKGGMRQLMHAPPRAANLRRQGQQSRGPPMMQKLQTVLSKSTSDALHVQVPVAALSTPTGERKHHTTSTATMSADLLQAVADAGKGKGTRSLLRVVILCLIAGAAIASRLFSVIREYPYFGLRELGGAANAGQRQLLGPSRRLYTNWLANHTSLQVSRASFTNVGSSPVAKQACSEPRQN
jgi:hypothetical protein